MYIDRIQKTLLSLLGHSLFSAPLDIDPDTDWKAVFNESKMQAVSVSAFNNYKELPIDTELKAKIGDYLKRKMTNNLFCVRSHAYIHKLMTDNGIPYCILKGIASASYYKDILLRNMGDVDFYVHPDDLERAEGVLLAEGFVPAKENHEFHIAYDKGASHVEMHFKPIGAPEGELGRTFEEYWSDIRETSKPLDNVLAPYRCPSSFHHGFVMLTHLGNHLVSAGVGLRHFCDWAVFSNSFSNEEFIGIFEKRLKRTGLWRLAQLLSLGAVEALGMPYKAWMGDDTETACELLEDILKGGNFGRKDSQRTYEGYFLSNSGEKGLKGSRIIRAVRSVNRRVDSCWTLPKRCPILYPLGWIYILCRLFVRIVTGRRRIAFSKAYKQSGARRDLYSRIGLLEPEE